MTLTAKEFSAPPEIFKSARTTAIKHQGPFTMHFNLPGHNVPGAIDHGYGPLALIVESLLEPGTWIRFHPHTNDEIISWVPGGLMRHNDRTGGKLITDKNHLMVMNAGSGFWHEERTLESDPDLRMLQIFVRPHAADLEPRIQHGEISEAPANQWRYLFGPEGSDAPFFVRNDVHFHDIRLDKGGQVEMPEVPAGWHTYFYVFTGKIAIGGESFGEGETRLITSSARMSIDADEESISRIRTEPKCQISPTRHGRPLDHPAFATTLDNRQYLESTDGAYVKADSTFISPKVSGYLAEVLVGDNKPVKAGRCWPELRA